MTTASVHVKKTFQSEFAGEKSGDYDYAALYRQRMIEFRRNKDSIVRVDKPLNLPRARELGYRAKEGFVVVRVRVRKGSGMHLRPTAGRRPKRMGVKKLTRRISIQAMAEQRASKKHKNCEVLNSYLVGEDGQTKYYEVIMVDTSHPVIVKDKKLKWITGEKGKKHRGRADRGLTSAGSKMRGLRKRGIGAEKVRPSLRAHDRKAK
ncbi:MAG: 50S ribosomal protein L15e [Candidatus Diapherotrites archaeon]|nr:50S ribosomal protein L15e [Candidatus Micrarchaeota archaeon]